MVEPTDFSCESAFVFKIFVTDTHCMVGFSVYHKITECLRFLTTFITQEDITIDLTVVKDTTAGILTIRHVSAWFERPVGTLYVFL